MKQTFTVEFDEEDLGEGWFNVYNLEACLYGKEHTRKDLLKIIDYKEDGEYEDNT